MSLFSSILSSPLGDVVAISTIENLVLLEFSNSDELENKKIKLENVY